MALSLPANPDLEHLRREARRLQRAVRSGEPRAIVLVSRLHPEGAPGDPTTFALSDAQLVVARSLGFASWPRLRTYLAAAAGLSRDPAALDPVLEASAGVDAAESASVTVALACLTYTERDEPERWSRAAQLLADDPDLVHRDVFVAAAAGDAEALRSHLAADRGAPTREGGPFRWPPLLHLVYSRVPQVDAVGSARVLLDAGADPDSGYLWQGLPTAFTALTGVFGEGEQGPGRQPRHPQWQPLAELLLERGADPNDRQTLYNRMFNRDDSHLELLLAHGLGRPSSEVWTRRTGEPAETIEEMITRQVDWARSHGFVDRLELLAAHGLVPDGAADLTPDDVLGDDVPVTGPWPGDPTVPDIHRAATPEAVRAAVAAGARVDSLRDGRTALHQAAFMDDVELVTALLEVGADPTVVDAMHGTTPYRWALWARGERAAAVLRGATGRHTSRALDDER
ncbi:ankyrin repeat domain-containing protein [Terracoccus sp. 273MFTsu3.1]|uniref:ankyrin repeat domain-containing protein n=1 Tax=Terracoccus sp. 273MFTsu3.1 TaxID=1172188 RepID=UPI0003624BE2|nr:ankyrin repeat domain-containing protein [Terracoccus sp. 273MFTsu3.1]